mmetsp:Transcript_20159/g.45093  ORF Transcript_20159/g.45093 Transcript_20159/m.45093 type:complete len:190 (+) Transcript_20159:616-1185(+)
MDFLTFKADRTSDAAVRRVCLQMAEELGCGRLAFPDSHIPDFLSEELEREVHVRVLWGAAAVREGELELLRRRAAQGAEALRVAEDLAQRRWQHPHTPALPALHSHRDGAGTDRGRGGDTGAKGTTPTALPQQISPARRHWEAPPASASPPTASPTSPTSLSSPPASPVSPLVLGQQASNSLGLVFTRR